MPRPRRPSLLLLLTLILAIPTLLSLRYAFTYSPSPTIRFGLISAGLWLKLEGAPASFSPFPTAPMRPPPVVKHQPIYCYRHGFSIQWWYEHTAITANTWSIPLWPLFAALTGFWTWRSARRRFGRKSWQCQHCGYDLRGLSSPLCPECGQSPRASMGP